MVVQFLVLLVAAPVAILALAWRAVWGFLVATGIGLLLGALQLMGIPIGRQLSTRELASLLVAFLLTALGLTVAHRVKRMWHRHRIGLSELVAALLRKVRDYFLVE